MLRCSHLGENVYWVFLMHLHVKLHGAWLRVQGDPRKDVLKTIRKRCDTWVPIAEASPEGHTH